MNQNIVIIFLFDPSRNLVIVCEILSYKNGNFNTFERNQFHAL